MVLVLVLLLISWVIFYKLYHDWSDLAAATALVMPYLELKDVYKTPSVLEDTSPINLIWYCGDWSSEFMQKNLISVQYEFIIILWLLFSFYIYIYVNKINILIILLCVHKLFCKLFSWIIRAHSKNNSTSAKENNVKALSPFYPCFHSLFQAPPTSAPSDNNCYHVLCTF